MNLAQKNIINSMQPGPMKRMLGVLRREFQDHKTGMVWVPAVIAGIMLLVLIGGMISNGDMDIMMGDFRMSIMGQKLEGAFVDVMDKNMGGITAMLMFALGTPILIVIPFLVVFGLLGSLYDDRKERSILFWKSMPVSDTQEVLLKFAGLVLIAPAVVILVALVFQFLAVTLVSAYLAFVTPIGFFSAVFSAPWFTMPIYTFTVYLAAMIGLLPLLAWAMFVSSMAPKAPLLLAVLPIAVFNVIEASYFRTHHFANWLEDAIRLRLPEPDPVLVIETENTYSKTIVSPFEVSDAFVALGDKITQGQTLVGIVMAGALIAGAIYARRYNI